MSDNTRASPPVLRRAICRGRADLVFSRTSLMLARAAYGDQAVWWSQTGSNRRPPACKAGALPTELWPLSSERTCQPATSAVRRLACQPKRRQPRRLVGLGRFELPTSRLSSARSNQLSYKPAPWHGLQRKLPSAGLGSFAKKEK
jgi:hypothetical protein